MRVRDVGLRPSFSSYVRFRFCKVELAAGFVDYGFPSCLVSSCLSSVLNRGTTVICEDSQSLLETSRLISMGRPGKPKKHK